MNLLERIKERLAVLRKVNGIVIHSINNHLSGMYGMAQLAQATGKKEYADQAVEMTVTACKRIKQLAEKTGEYTAGLDPHTTQTDPGRVVAMISVLLGREMEKRGVSINVEADEELTIKAVPADIQEALFRILWGAVHIMDDKNEVGVNCSEDNGHIMVCITGPGIARWAADGPAEDGLADEAMIRDALGVSGGAMKIGEDVIELEWKA